MRRSVFRLVLASVLSLPLTSFAGDQPGRDPMSAIKLDLSNVCSKRGNDPFCAPPPVPPSRQQLVADLVRAAGEGDVAGIQAALAAGAPVDGRNANGETALAFAAFNRQAEAVRVLLAARANPNIPTASAQTFILPLCFAGMAGQPGITDALLAAGATPGTNSVFQDEKETYRVSPAACAAAGGNVGVLNAILQRGGSPDADKGVANARPPLYFAAAKNNPAMIAALCARKANANVAVHSKSLLRGALESKQYPVAQALLACKANPNWRDADGVSELRYLVRQSDTEGIFLLNRFKPNFKDQLNGVSILEETVANGEPRIKTMRALLVGGASPKDERLLGRMTEYWLTKSGTMDQNMPMETMALMHELLNKGASTTEQVNGNSLVSLVLGSYPNFYMGTGLYEYFVDLVKADAGANEPNNQGQLPVVQSYLRLRNAPDKLGNIIDVFAARGVDINATQPSDGRNLLDTASWNNDMANRKLLQDHGACRAARRVDNEWRYCRG
jgi:ankyrin repeat protein